MILDEQVFRNQQASLSQVEEGQPREQGSLIWIPPVVVNLSQWQVEGGSTSNQLETSSGLIGS